MSTSTDLLKDLKDCLDLETFEKIVTEFFQYEIRTNKDLYVIHYWKIPTNPHIYIDKCIEKMRRRLMKVVLELMLKRQRRDSKILLLKLISKHVESYLDTFKKETLKVHYNAWYTIQELMEKRDV